MEKNEKRACGRGKRRRRGERKRPGSFDAARDAALRDPSSTKGRARIGGGGWGEGGWERGRYLPVTSAGHATLFEL